MAHVRLTGQLVCSDSDQAAGVAAHLPAHISLTLAEPGCLEFRVDRTADPLVWNVSERFTDRGAFEAHQRRVEASEWGRATAGIERRYLIEDD